MLRLLPIAGFAILSLGLSGCAADWDTLTSHRFLDGMVEHPWETTKGLWVLEDPMLVLRTDPPRDGDERASAMHRVKEPILNGGTAEDQDIIVNILARSASTDPSPVIRMEAIGALGRFQDPRVVGALITAYQSAHGRRGFDPPPAPLLAASGLDLPPAVLSAGRAPTNNRIKEVDTTHRPSGFLPEWVTAVRCRSLESLGRTNRVEAAQFLAAVAGGAGSDVTPEGSEDRDVRLAAVRGLGQCRVAESVLALNRVLAQSMAIKPDLRDTAIINRTHEGLVSLTGKQLPPEPEKWNEVVQAGVIIVPESPWWDTTIKQVSGWVKEQ